MFYKRLWHTDGVTAALTSASAYQVGDLIDVDGTLFFKATYDIGNGNAAYGLFRSGAQGAALLRTINPTQGRGVSTSQARVNGTLFFGAENATGGLGLWTSDGTEAGTTLVSAINPSGPGPAELIDVQGVAYFAAADDVHGSQLWRSDGTEANTRPVSCPFP